MDSNQRTCPLCKKTITHSDTRGAQKADRLRKPCSGCRYSTRKLPTLNKCPMCSFESKRLTSFEKHIIDTHATTAKQLWDSVNGPTICPCGCNQETKWINWNLGYNESIIGHNAKSDFKIATIGDEETRKQLDARNEKLRGRKGWAKGLTKETDDRIALRAQATSIGRKIAFVEGKITSWSKGSTKATDQRLARLSETLSLRYSSGELVPHMKGKTKDTDEKVREMALKVSMTHKNTALRKHLDEIKRLKTDEIKQRIESSSTLTLIGDLNNYVNDNTPNIQVKCTKCNTVFSGTLRKLVRGRCFKCAPGGSKAQNEIADFVESLVFTVGRNVRGIIGSDELDVYVPSRQLAIEYNGLYWHSVQHKSSNYHESKTLRCEKLGIRLMHIFEDEWRDKKEIVKSMISHRLGVTQRKVAARKCSARSLTVIERKTFFDRNHIDGDTNATHAIGLFLGDELVSAISLRRPFHKKHVNKLEVARLVSSTNTVVQGGLGKLKKESAKYASSNNVNEIMSYVDCRFGSSSSWNEAGWKTVSRTPPRFWWTDFDNRFNRFKFRADKSRNMTEAAVAEEMNVCKIWGCGNLLLTFKCTAA